MLSQPSHFFCSEDIAAYVALDSVSMVVGEFSIYLHCYLELEACTILAQFKKKKTEILGNIIIFEKRNRNLHCYLSISEI